MHQLGINVIEILTESRGRSHIFSGLNESSPDVKERHCEEIMTDLGIEESNHLLLIALAEGRKLLFRTIATCYLLSLWLCEEYLCQSLKLRLVILSELIAVNLDVEAFQ